MLNHGGAQYDAGAYVYVDYSVGNAGLLEPGSNPTFHDAVRP